MNAVVTMCPCGRALHYTDPSIETAVTEMVERLGETIPVYTPQGGWFVPRHYIALHGLKAW